MPGAPQKKAPAEAGALGSDLQIEWSLLQITLHRKINWHALLIH
jgi:hypothetical protein